MGRQAGPAQLFYNFCLDDHVPADHMLRRIDLFLDLESVRQELKPFYSRTGRPSVDPELMIRMLIVGYSFGIQSERRHCDGGHSNPVYLGFCRLGLNGKVPDQSTLSKNRHGRFRESDLFRQVFETVVQRCIDEGLVGGEGFAVDASLIEDDANKQRAAPASEWDPADIPPDAKKAVQDYLARLEDAAFGAASEVTPKFVSTSDTATQWTEALCGPAFFAHAANYLIDTDNAVIVDVEATRAICQAKMGAARTMIERVMDRLGLCPERLADDIAYGTVEMLGWLVENQGIEPHVPVFDKGERDDGTFSCSDFAYDHNEDAYSCPASKSRRPRRREMITKPVHVDKYGTQKYRASKWGCSVCPLKSQCYSKTPMHIVLRLTLEGAWDMARASAETDEGDASRNDRKKVEMLFVHLKRILRLGRLRLRGTCGASDEYLLAATAQNPRKLAKLRPKHVPGVVSA